MAVALDGTARASGWCWSGSEEIPVGTGPQALLALRDRPPGEHRLAVDGSDATCAVVTVRPAPRVTLIGASPELPAMIRFGRQMGWHLTVIDHRPAVVNTYGAQADATLLAMPAAGLAQLADQPQHAVVLMTHSAARDLEALRALSTRTEQYVGLLGPVARRDALMQQLEPAQRTALTERLRSPIGFKLGGDGPEVLALSIAAELQQFLTTPR
jgi:xanthine dehydrogenase accessory factor